MSFSNKLASCSIMSFVFSFILLGLLIVVIKFLAENLLLIIAFLGIAVFSVFLRNYLTILFAKWERNRAWKKLEREINQELDEEFTREKHKQQKSHHLS